MPASTLKKLGDWAFPSRATLWKKLSKGCVLSLARVHFGEALRFLSVFSTNLIV